MHTNHHLVPGLCTRAAALGIWVRQTTRVGRHAARMLAWGLSLGVLGAPFGASAVTFYVDTAGAGAACTLAAPCPLISSALALAVSGDTINVAAGTYTEANLSIAADISIVGANALTTTIDAAGLGNRIFAINANVVLDKLTLQNADISLANGGAIELTSGNLTILRSRLLNNDAAPGGAGGAIAAGPYSGQVTLVATTVQGNNAAFDGGAIWCDGCAGVNLLLSRVIENTVGSLGGAIYTRVSRVIIRASSVSRNSAQQGGAIFADYAEVHVLDSEVSGNTATTGTGGGIYINGELNIERSTLAENHADANTGGAVFIYGAGIFASANSTSSGNSAFCGGALMFDVTAGMGADVIIGTATFVNNVGIDAGCSADHIVQGANTIELYNSIISGTGTHSSCSAPLTGGAHNLIDVGGVPDTSCNTGTVDFNLGAVTGLNTTLGYNGGLTRTHNLGAASNAVDAGRNVACVNPWASWGGAPLVPLVIDQRGRPRPVNNTGLGGIATCDIGAVELQ